VARLDRRTVAYGNWARETFTSNRQRKRWEENIKMDIRVYVTELRDATCQGSCPASHSRGWSPNCVHSARRPFTGLLYLPRVIVRMVNLVEWWLAGEIEVLWENLPQSTLSTTNPTWPESGSNRAVAVGSQRLTAWAMARPSRTLLLTALNFRILFLISKFNKQNHVPNLFEPIRVSMW
jgi:hypothetical protein